MDDEHRIQEMEIVLTSESIEPKIRTMDFGAITVCSKCGNGRIPSCDEVRDGTYVACCDGATLIPLRKYYEEVKGIPFKNEEWSFSVENIYSSPECERLCKQELSSNVFGGMIL